MASLFVQTNTDSVPGKTVDMAKRVRDGTNSRVAVSEEIVHGDWLPAAGGWRRKRGKDESMEVLQRH